MANKQSKRTQKALQAAARKLNQPNRMPRAERKMLHKLNLERLEKEAKQHGMSVMAWRIYNSNPKAAYKSFKPTTKGIVERAQLNPYLPL